MFLDASAIIAVVSREAGSEEIVRRLEAAVGPIRVSPIVRYEAVLGLARKLDGGTRSRTVLAAARATIEEFFRVIDAEEIPISAEIGSLALEASMTYGKAVGHQADLNFGDCFAYACAKNLNAALVYKGNDFALTDLG